MERQGEIHNILDIITSLSAGGIIWHNLGPMWFNICHIIQHILFNIQEMYIMAFIISVAISVAFHLPQIMLKINNCIYIVLYTGYTISRVLNTRYSRVLMIVVVG